VAVERVVLRPNPIELVLVLATISFVVGLVGNAMDRRHGREGPRSPGRGLHSVARTLAGCLVLLVVITVFEIATLFAGWLVWPPLVLLAAIGVGLFVRGARDVWRFAGGSRAHSRLTSAIATITAVAVYGLVVLARPAWVAPPAGCEGIDQDGEPSPVWEPIGLPHATSPEEAAAAFNVRAPIAVGKGDQRFVMRPSESGGVELAVEAGSYLGLSDLDGLIDAAVGRAGVRVIGSASASGGVPQPHVSVYFETPDGAHGRLEARDCTGGLHRPNLVNSVMVVGPDRVGDCTPRERQPVCKAMIEAGDAAIRSNAERLDVVPRPHADADGNLRLSYEKPTRMFMGATSISLSSAQEDLEDLGWTVQRSDDRSDDLHLVAFRRVADTRIHLDVTYDGEDHVTGRLWSEPI
jgi:hypothetical protein